MPVRPVPIMLLAGTADHVQEYEGWLYTNGRLLSVPETMEYWRSLHGCREQHVRRLPHRNDDDRTRVVVIEWSACRSRSPVRLYRIVNGGHQMPSLTGGASLPEQRFGRRNRDIETAEEVWAFIKRYTH